MNTFVHRMHTLWLPALSSRWQQWVMLKSDLHLLNVFFKMDICCWVTGLHRLLYRGSPIRICMHKGGRSYRQWQLPTMMFVVAEMQLLLICSKAQTTWVSLCLWFLKSHFSSPCNCFPRQLDFYNGSHHGWLPASVANGAKKNAQPKFLQQLGCFLVSVL